MTDRCHRRENVFGSYIVAANRYTKGKLDPTKYQSYNISLDVVLTLVLDIEQKMYI